MPEPMECMRELQATSHWCAEWEAGVGTMRGLNRPSFGCLNLHGTKALDLS